MEIEGNPGALIFSACRIGYGRARNIDAENPDDFARILHAGSNAGDELPLHYGARARYTVQVLNPQHRSFIEAGAGSEDLKVDVICNDVDAARKRRDCGRVREIDRIRSCNTQRYGKKRNQSA